MDSLLKEIIKDFKYKEEKMVLMILREEILKSLESKRLFK